MRERLGLTGVRLIPAACAPLRGPPRADAQSRLRMLEVAVGDCEAFQVDDRELRRGGTSFTVDTLESLRDELDDCALCLILGMDAFSRLDEWQEAQKIPELAHICVAKRPGSSLPASGVARELVSARGTEDPCRLSETSAGRVMVCDIPALQVSGTEIRALIASGRSPRFLVPEAVLEIMKQDGLYRDA